MNITKTELIEILKGVKISTFVNLTTETKVRMNKTNNPYFEQITKRNKGNYLIGNDYEKRVNSNEVKEGLEGTFETKESSVGVHVSKCVLFNEKLNKFYLQYELFKEIHPKSEYVFEGNLIEKTLFENYMVKKSESSRQVQERKVLVQTLMIDSIKEITLEKEHYTII